MFNKILAIVLLSVASINAMASNAMFRVMNNSSEPIAQIVVSPTYRNRHGKTNLLGTKIILPGNSEKVDPGDTTDSKNECLLDVRAIGQYGSKWDKRIDVCDTAIWTIDGGGAKRIR